MPAPTPSRRPARALLLALSLAAAARAADTAGDPGETALGREIEQLQAETALADGGGFYLRLDAVAGTLELALDGVILERYRALGLERGVARVALWRRREPAGWDRLAYSSGQLEPPRERDRIEIVAPEVGTSPTPPPLPPTAEESVSVPMRWRVVFAQGLTLEVESEGEGRNRALAQRLADAWSLWWRDWSSAVEPQGGGRVWLRVRLSPEDAADLYRALPHGVGLVFRGAGAD